MSYQAMHKRLARLEVEEGLAFRAFLLRLSPADSRAWLCAVLETLAARGVISLPPGDLWEQPQSEKDAFLLMLRECIEHGHQGARAVIRQAWHAWEQGHL